MSKFKTVLVAIIVVLVIIVVLQNTESVETKILMASVTMPRAILLLITLLAGFAAGLVVSARARRAARKD